MQCPNCQMNIKDDAKFCIHCGTQFNVSMGTQVAQVQSGTSTCPKCQAPIQEGAQFCINCGAQLASTASQPAQTNQIMNVYTPEQAQADKAAQEKYFRTYLGSRYTSITNANFSFGTFFLGWPWLLFYKLYGAAGRLLLTQLVISFVAGLISRVIGILGSTVGLIANIYISYVYAQSFASAYRTRANSDVSDIMNQTQDEEERLKLCKKRGRPLYPALIIVCWPLVLLTVVPLLGAYSTVDNSRQDVFMDTSHAYLNAMKNAVLADELICGKAISEVGPGIYYYSFTTANGDSATKLLEQGGKSPWGNANVAGQIYIFKNYNSTAKIDNYQYGIVLVDEKGRGFGEFSESGQPQKIIASGYLNRSIINTSDGENRKIYYNKAKAGTKKALNKDTAPTSDAECGYTSFETFYKYAIENKTDSNPKPVACDIKNG